MVKVMWRITYAHVIAFFVAGVFAMLVMNYEEHYLTYPLSLLMKPTSDPFVALAGSALQIFRGIILALVIYPLHKAFFEEKHGYLKLWLIVFGLSVISTFGPGIGAFDGYLFTTLPVSVHVLGYPEALIYISLFVGILNISNRFAEKRIVKVLPIMLMVLICLMGIAPYLLA
jgi:hypothetical protein